MARAVVNGLRGLVSSRNLFNNITLLCSIIQTERLVEMDLYIEPRDIVVAYIAGVVSTIIIPVQLIVLKVSFYLISRDITFYILKIISSRQYSSILIFGTMPPIVFFSVLFYLNSFNQLH